MARTAISPFTMPLGDTAAEASDFDSLVSLHRPRIFRFALASLRDRDAAETITQDCFLNAYRAKERFRGDCSINTWLMQIAVNLIRDYARNRRFQFWKRTTSSAPPLEGFWDRLPDGKRSAEGQAIAREQVKAVWDAAASLPAQQRTVFLLRFVEDMDLLEIAAATGLKEGTVKTHLFRALQAVRDRMGASK